MQNEKSDENHVKRFRKIGGRFQVLSRPRPKDERRTWKSGGDRVAKLEETAASRITYMAIKPRRRGFSFQPATRL